MPKSVTEGFTAFLANLTPTPTQRDAAASHRASVQAALKATLTVNAFFETGSFTHGTGVRHRSDVDALVSIGNAKPGSSDTALAWVKSALEKRFPSTPVRISRPAVVVDFAGGAQAWEVIPGFVNTSASNSSPIVYDIPGASSGWIKTAPKEHLAYVNDKNKKPSEGCAKALARLLKGWKYYSNVPVSSFYLEMRAAEHVGTQTNFIYPWDLWQVLHSLREHALAAMNDPQGVVGRIYPCSSDARKTEARSKLDTAVTRARKALDAYNDDKPDDAFQYLNLLFGGQFPAR